MTIDYEVLYDKVYGAWLGKCAGGIIGAKQENNKNMMNYNFSNIFPNTTPPNDDFDLQILYLQEVLEKKGFNFDSFDLAREFAVHNTCWANEYRVAIRNNNAGIMPPSAGEFNNEFFKNSMGCPIRSELWALVSAGNPTLAVKFAEQDGCIDHSDDSIEAEKFLAAMEALAFAENDIYKLIDSALNYISSDCVLHSCVKYMIELYRQKLPIATSREKLVKRFGSSDASYCVTNMGITILALLYGEMNFNNTMILAVNCGYDTDCTAATAGSILGIIKGYKALPQDWKDKIGETFVVGTVNIVRERNKLSQLTYDTIKATYALSRDKINNLEIKNIPAHFVCDYPVTKINSAIKVNYQSTPEIYPKHTNVVLLEVENTHLGELQFEVSLSMPTHLLATVDGASKKSYCLKAGQKAKIEITVTCKDIKLLPVKNIVEVNFSGAIQKTIEVGFLGAAKFKVVGPFFDNYDTTKQDKDFFESIQPDSLFAMFNGYADIDRQYINEQTELTEGEITDCLELITASDKLPLENIVHYKGTCCIYAIYDFVSPIEQTINMLLGYSSPHKIFLNGQVIASGHSFEQWMPLNNTVPLTLKKGKNRLAFKLIRKNGSFEFSQYLTHADFSKKVLVELENIF